MAHYHIGLNKEQVPYRVIVCGDPARVDIFANSLSNPQTPVHNREYRSILGEFNTKKILIISHGVGSAGAAVCFHELMELGAKKIIRIGTAGGLQDQSRVGDVVCATGAVRDDGASQKMIPEIFPAVCDFRLVGVLEKNFNLENLAAQYGLVLTSDIFYPQVLATNLELYRDAGVLAAEMELATLLTLAALKNTQAAGVLVLDGNPLKWDQGEYDPDSKLKATNLLRVLKVVLAALTDC